MNLQRRKVNGKERKMVKFMEIGLILAAVVAVALADVVLKRAATAENMVQAIKSPWMAGALGLYLLQILLMTYAFVLGWELSIMGTIQIVCYAIVVVTAGIFYFRESLSPVQLIGLVLAVGGAVLVSVDG